MRARSAYVAALRAQAATLSSLADALEAEADDDRSTPSRADEWLDARSCSPLSYRRVLALVSSGELPASRDGRRVLVRRADVDAWIAAQRTSPARESPANDSLASDIAALRRTVAQRRQRSGPKIASTKPRLDRLSGE